MSTRTSKARPKAKEPTVAPAAQQAADADTPASVSLDAVVADARDRQRAREDAKTAANRTEPAVHDADQEHDHDNAETTTADTTEAMTETPDTTEPTETEPPWPPIQEDLAWGLWL